MKRWRLRSPILDIVDNQVRSLRKCQVIAAFQQGQRDGAYWGIRTNIQDYQVDGPLPCPFDKTLMLARIPIRLKGLSDAEQMLLINWGYAVCDAAMRKHVDPAISRPADFPYPGQGVGQLLAGMPYPKSIKENPCVVRWPLSCCRLHAGAILLAGHCLRIFDRLSHRRDLVGSVLAPRLFRSPQARPSTMSVDQVWVEDASHHHGVGHFVSCRISPASHARAVRSAPARLRQ